MAYRRFLSLLSRRSEIMPPFQQNCQHIISHTLPEHASHLCHRSQRALHTSPPLMMKLLSVDELFASSSLQAHLKRIEKEYNDCLQVVSGNAATDESREYEMKTKRSTVSLHAPLVQSIRELDRKQKEINETEMLLKGEMRNCEKNNI